MHGAAATTQHVVAARCDFNLEVASLEEQIQEKLKDLQLIRTLDKKWSEGVRTEVFPYDKNTAKQIHEYYLGWLKGTEELLKRISAVEAQGKRISSSQEFRDAVGYCPAGIDIDATAANFEKLERGEGVPLTEAVNGKIRGRGTC